MTAVDHLSFAFDGEGRVLYAHFQPLDHPEPVTAMALRDLLSELGHGDLLILQDGLSQLETSCRNNTEAITVAVAERRDAEISVEVADDGMEARLSVTAPMGGAGLDRERLFAALYEAGIVYGVLSEVIETVLAAGVADQLVIARGQGPLRGDNARFESLVDNPQRGTPRLRDDGSVDYFDLGIVTSVQVGQGLMRKIPATDGTPGTTVRGEPIAAEPGRDVAFGPLSPSVHFDEADANLLVAAIAGQPRLGPNWAKVEPVIELRDVDLSTGNIKFDGNVIIRGMVAGGLSVWAGGDVVVDGVVEAATIEAQGNIELRGGIVGQGEARIKAKGSITTRFIESAHVEAGDSLHVIDLIMHSDVTALNRVEVSGGNKAQIIGGTVRAAQLIKARVFGSPAAVQTRLEVGVNPYMKSQLDDLSQELLAKRRKLDEASKALIHLKLHPRPGQEAQARSLENSRELLMAETMMLSEQQQQLQTMLGVSQNCKIIATDKIYSGTKIKISDIQRSIEEDMGGCSFRLRDSEVVIGPT